MTNNSIYIQRVNNGYTNFLNAEEFPIKLSRTGIFLCQSGEVKCTLDGIEYNIEPHSIMTYFAFSELKINYRSSDLQGIIIGGDLEAIQPLLYRISDFNSLFTIRSNPYTLISPKQEDNMLMYTSLLEDLVARLLGRIDIQSEEREQTKEMRILQLEMLSNCLMLNIVSCYTHNNQTNKLANRKEDVLLKFIASLYRNFKKQHEVTFYADQQFLTSRYFSAIIKDKSGKSPSQWIATALLVEAKNKLRQSTKSIKEISEDLNFPNQSYFGKWFKNLTGISPLEYKTGTSEKKQSEDEFTEMVRRGSTFVNTPEQS